MGARVLIPSLKEWVKRFSLPINFIFFHKLFGALEKCLAKEYPYWPVWIPVGLGLGIGAYFSLSFEPTLKTVGIGTLIFLPIAAASLQKFSLFLRFIGWGVLLMLIGFWSALWRTQHLQTMFLKEPLSARYVTGVIDSIEHPASKTRLFQRIILKPQDTMARFSKLSIFIQTDAQPLKEGQTVRLMTKLFPIPASVLPNSYNPRFVAFYKNIGAKGYALNIPEVLEEPKPSFRYMFSLLRHALTRKIHAHLPPPLGAMGCALVTGDKISLPYDVRDAFSSSGLSHLLAISGLHLSVVAGICFFVFYRLLAWVPGLALHINLQKISAFFSLGLGWVYLEISGRNYPAKRAFLMMALALIGVLLARTAVTLRVIAVVATVILLLQPEALLDLGFQLSFFAVMGLVSFYEVFQKKKNRSVKGIGRGGVFFKQLFFSTLVASLVTAPFLMFHFHVFSFQGLLTNFVALPLTVFVIIPFAILSLLSLLFSGSHFFFWMWGKSLQGLLLTAQWSAKTLSFLMLYMPPYAFFLFFLMVSGVLWCILWTQKWRFLGFIPIVLGIGGTFFFSYPQLLIDPEQKILGYVDKEKNTLWVSSKQAGRFVSKRWAKSFGLQNIQKIPWLPDGFFVFNLPNGKKMEITTNPYFSKTSDYYVSWKEKILNLPEKKLALLVSGLLYGNAYMVFCKKGVFEIKSEKESHRPWDF